MNAFKTGLASTVREIQRRSSTSRRLQYLLAILPTTIFAILFLLAGNLAAEYNAAFRETSKDLQAAIEARNRDAKRCEQTIDSLKGLADTTYRHRMDPLGPDYKDLIHSCDSLNRVIAYLKAEIPRHQLPLSGVGHRGPQAGAGNLPRKFRPEIPASKGLIPATAQTAEAASLKVRSWRVKDKLTKRTASPASSGVIGFRKSELKLERGRHRRKSR
ncbi:MAG TPA: hypothetical protein VHI13_19050 [Candidatus Kapabacteria bacterium]|nr:hypothetical protein [Candidatus Kapabacteria bacterium]